jgi:hypothetical protein
LLDAIEAKCNEILGNYSKTEAEALHWTFEAPKKTPIESYFPRQWFLLPLLPSCGSRDEEEETETTQGDDEVSQGLCFEEEARSRDFPSSGRNTGTKHFVFYFF